MDLIVMGLSPCRNRLSTSHWMMVVQLVWLPSIVIFSGLPCRVSALRIKRLAAFRSWFLLNSNSNSNSKVLRLLTMARNRYIPPALDLHIGLIQIPFAFDRTLLPIEAVNRGRGRRPEQNRAIINSTLWGLRCGTPWRDVPPQIRQLEYDLLTLSALKRSRGLGGRFSHPC